MIAMSAKSISASAAIAASSRFLPGGGGVQVGPDATHRRQSGSQRADGGGRAVDAERQVRTLGGELARHHRVVPAHHGSSSASDYHFE
ncbi:hypothetical protein [Amycolatopsis deserti]|uniref:hypothetical protein n=1 Tax=Amycolatopsis deserti TaxID=185696 RepID=UPI00174D103D|nr:hypothetical protein [Amycolatopsis deserti]